MTRKRSGFFRSLRIVTAGALAGAGVIYLLAPKPPRPPQSVSSLDELEDFLRSCVENSTPPGLSLAVVKGGQVVYQRGFGAADGPNQIPADADTVYHWWSMTKVVTAMAVLQLQEQGRLSIDDPVTRYVPFFEVRDEADRDVVITVRQLLNHSAGLRDALPEILGWVHWDEDPPCNQTELLREKFPAYARLAFTPGEYAQYSNVGYMALGAVIEAASGQRYEDYVAQHILRPLKMDLTGFVYTADMMYHEAAGSQHVINPFTPLMIPTVDLRRLVGSRQGLRLWFNRVYNDQTPPSGLIGPVSDLARLIQAYLNGGELDGARILTPESVALMTGAHHIAPKSGGYRQGIAWRVQQDARGRTYLDHAGGGPGFATDMRIYPEAGLGLVLMGNDTAFQPWTVLDLAAGLDW